MSAFQDLRPAPPEASRATPAVIRSAVDRERRAFAGLGQFGPEVEHEAIAITRTKPGNAPDLAELQMSPAPCHACGGPLDDTRPVIAVTTGRPRSPLWLHGGACHDAHRRRRAARVDALMTAAGFGPTTPSPHQEPEIS